MSPFTRLVFKSKAVGFQRFQRRVVASFNGVGVLLHGTERFSQLAAQNYGSCIQGIQHCSLVRRLCLLFGEHVVVVAATTCKSIT